MSTLAQCPVCGAQRASDIALERHMARHNDAVSRLPEEPYVVSATGAVLPATLLPGTTCPLCFRADGTLRCDGYMLIGGAPFGTCTVHGVAFDARGKKLTPEPERDDPGGFRIVDPVYLFATSPKSIKGDA